jgi:hypothetical protein
MLDEPGVLLALAHTALVLAALVAAALALPAGVTFVLLAITVLLGATAQAHAWALLLGVSAWAIWTGFFEDSLGQLAVAPPDLVRLAAMAIVGLAGSYVHLRPVRRG